MKRKASVLDNDEVSQPQRPPHFDVCTNGDVLLKVGSGAQAIDIKVSEKKISEASPAFSSMLSAGFKETSSRVVKMPEDRPRCVLQFAHIIHGQEDKAKELKADDFRNMIMFADKYMCQHAVAAHLRLVAKPYIRWVEKVHGNPMIDDDFPEASLDLDIEDLIIFAAVFNVSDLFHTATRAFMVHGTEAPEANCEASNLSALRRERTHIFVVLERLRKTAIVQLYRKAVRAVRTIGVRVNRARCRHSAKEQLEEWKKRLSDVGLDPKTNPAGFPHSWLTGVQYIERKAEVGLFGWEEPPECEVCDIDDTFSSNALWELILEVVTEADDSLLGMCLPCFRATGKGICSNHRHSEPRRRLRR